MHRGRVLKSTGKWYVVEDEEGNEFNATLRGKLKLTYTKNTNPVSVGDWVSFIKTDTNDFVISEIEKRINYIIRKSVNLSKETHIIASNIDLACLVVSIAQPKITYGFIDRFLVTAECYSIPSIIVVNKSDLWNQEQQQEAEELKNIYENINYKVFFVSAENNNGIEELKEILKNKVTLFSGHSGVGKSTIVNALNNKLEIKTAKISSYNQKGQHTTTFAQMHKWSFGGYLVDTPGIKEFGLVDLSKEEIQDYFPEILAHKNKCKYNNCLHIGEHGCEIIKLVEAGVINKIRYKNYLSFLEKDIN
ncbi:MAG: ribosome small subunit-dependent GTPase A [Solirubrobacteraceae bacterium]